MKKYKQRLDSFFEKITENKIIKVRLDELNFHPELEQAFKINEDVKNRIKDDIKENGNNTKAHPIHIFRMDVIELLLSTCIPNRNAVFPLQFRSV